ncbi:MAG: extracellular solute-binding protein [Leptolinea sp.]
MQFLSQKNTVYFARLFIPGLLLGSLITGCSNLPQPAGISPTISVTSAAEISINTPLENPATPIPSATIPVELSSLKGSEIKIIHPWSGESGAVVRDLIFQFNRDNIWGIHVEEVVRGSTSEAARTYIESMQSSDRLNILVIPTEYLVGWNVSGKVIDLAPFIANSEWGIPKKEREDFLPQTWTANTIGNQQIGIPAQINLQFLVYNRTWAKELGFSTDPQTQAEFIKQVCVAAHANNFDNQKENDGTGGWIINSSSQTILSWINAFGGSKAWASDSQIAINQAETGEAFTYLRNLFMQGCAWNSRVASPFTYFSNRQALAFSATLPDLLELEETLAFTKNTEEWGIFPYPGETKPSPVMMTGLAYGISKTSPTNELASWLFLRWMMLPRHQARLAEASGSIPAARSAIDLMKTFAETHTWWKTAVNLVPEAQMLPPSAAWRQGRLALEDGFWQMLQPTPMPIPTLLEKIDETIRSLP